MFKNNSGFTLIEMLIVLTIISVLIILIAPNLGKSNQQVHEKSCDALVSVAQSQVQLYYLEENKYPNDLADLIEGGYLNEDQTKCPNGKSLDYDPETGEVSID